MFPLIETIKILDGMPKNLPYHQHRFEASYYKFYKEFTSVKLKDIIQVPQEHRQGLVKLRFLYNKTDCFCQYDEYQFKPVKTLKIVESEIDYSLKFVDRKEIEALLKQKEAADDILIVKNNRITDTSFTNVVFYDGSEWLTPQFPLLHGTARARLLHQKIIKTVDIGLSDLKYFKSFRLINALRDFETANTLPIDNILM